jgi:Flp pilus assembly protein TadD
MLIVSHLFLFSPLLFMLRKILIVLLGVLASAYPLRLEAQYDVREAVDVYMSGKWQKARLMLQKNLQIDSTDVYSRLYLGIMLEREGSLEEAIELWKKGMNNRSTDVEFLFRIASTYHKMSKNRYSSPYSDSLRKQHYENSLEYYQKAHEASPYMPDALEALISVLGEKNRHQEAIPYANDLIQLYPDDFNYVTKKAQLYLKNEDYDSAYHWATHSIEMHAQQAEAYQILAQVCKQRDDKEAEELYRRKYQYYRWIPDFVEIEWDTTYYQILNDILSPNNSREVRNKAYEQLVPSKSAGSPYDRLMATLLYNNARLTKEQSERGISILATTDYMDNQNDMASGQYYLFEILEAKSSPYSQQKAILEALVREKAKGLARFLIEEIEADEADMSYLQRMRYDRDLYISTLRRLKDDTILPQLVRLLAPHIQQNEHYKERMPKHYLRNKKRLSERLNAYNARRAEAAFLISSLSHPEVDDILNEGLHNPDIAVYCAAALLVKKRDATYWEKIKDIQRKEKVLSPQLCDFLENNVSPHTSYYKELSKLLPKMR